METGAYYYLARYCDPQAGRFLSQDPIGFAAGDMNLYRYVGNSTPNYTDPMGLSAMGMMPMPARSGPNASIPVATTYGAGSPRMTTPTRPSGNSSHVPTVTTYDDSALYSGGFLSEYWFYLTNPGRMDTDLRYGFYGAVGTAGVCSIAASGLAVAGGLGAGATGGTAAGAAAAGVGGTAIAGGAGAGSTGAGAGVTGVGVGTATIAGPAVIKVGKEIFKWLGRGAVIKRHDQGGFVIQSCDRLRQLRIDFNGHGFPPHAHFEIRKFVYERFKDLPGLPHRIYFK